MIKISSSIQNKLLSLPESGMGYQVVEATYSDRSKKEAIIFNATIAEPTNNRSVEQIFKSLRIESFDSLYKSASVSDEIIDVKMKYDKGIFKSARVRMFDESKKEEKGADSAAIDYTKQGEYFIRFSHYEDDKRIDKVNKKVLPGTYATTFDDAKYCLQNHIDPRARYALPSNLTVEYAFHITPVENTQIKRGTVEPANEQPGGGKEVIFPQGTNNNSVIKTDKL